jgi:hypothetical protein
VEYLFRVACDDVHEVVGVALWKDQKERRKATKERRRGKKAREGRKSTTDNQFPHT